MASILQKVTPYDQWLMQAKNQWDPFANVYMGKAGAIRTAAAPSVSSATTQQAPYNVNTTPTAGQNNPAGLVPGPLSAVTPYQAGVTTMATPGAITPSQLGAPATVAMPDPYADLAKIIPGLAGMNAQAGSVISNDLSGRISPDVQRAIQTEAARFGAAGGMPGSVGQPGSLYNFKDLATLGTTSDANQQRGLASYGDFLKTISGTQTVSPGVQAGVNEANAGAINRVGELNAASLNNFSQFNTNLLAEANRWNAGALNQGSQFNAAAGNALAPLNVDIANRNSINAAAPDPWLALNYNADLYARNSAATAGKPYTSMFAPNTVSGGFGGFANPVANVDPWTAYLNKVASQNKYGSTLLSGYGAPGFGG
jgi:hypothetical protein